VLAGELTVHGVLGIRSYHQGFLGSWSSFKDSQDCLEIYQLVTHWEKAKETNDELSSVVCLISWTSFRQVPGEEKKSKG